jgi:uncharacterized membrane protein
MSFNKEKKPKEESLESTIKRIGGYLHRVVPVADKSGEILNYVLKPLMVEFKPRDIAQVALGSALMAIPVSFSEEVWNLGADLPSLNIGLIAGISIMLEAIFVYFNFYRFAFKGNVFEFIKRVLGTYLVTVLVVALILSLIEKCPWGTDNVLAIKRIIIVSFPSAMGGTLTDSLK